LVPELRKSPIQTLNYPNRPNFILKGDVARHVGYSSHRLVSLGCEISFLPSINRAGFRQATSSPHRAERSHSHLELAASCLRSAISTTSIHFPQISHHSYSLGGTISPSHQCFTTSFNFLHLGLELNWN